MQALAAYARFQKEEIGLSSNDQEILIGKNGLLYDVQLRPSLNIADSPQSPSEDGKEIIRTPFVLGDTFRVTGKLLVVRSITDLIMTLNEVLEILDPEEYILVVSADASTFMDLIPILAKREINFSGYIVEGGGTELTHSNHAYEGFTHLLRSRCHFLASVDFRFKLPEIPFTETIVSFGDWFKFAIQMSEDLFTISSDGRWGTISRILD